MNRRTLLSALPAFWLAPAQSPAQSPTLPNATYKGTTLTFFCVDLFTGISYGDYSSTPVFPRQ